MTRGPKYRLRPDAEATTPTPHCRSPSMKAEGLVEDEADVKERAAGEKVKGNAIFGKATTDAEFKLALSYYETAISLDPDDKVFHANAAACHLEIAKTEWNGSKKAEGFAKAYLAAQRAHELAPSWVKAHQRLALAEFELVHARALWDKEEQSESESGRGRDRGPGGEREREAERMAPDTPFEPPPQPEAALVPTIKEANFERVEATCRAGLAIEPGHAALRLRLQALRDESFATDLAKDAAIRDADAAATLKKEGNTFFAEKNYHAAGDKYTAALSYDPLDHIFYSNRSACHGSLDDGEKALRDADRCVALAPDYAKGHSRRGTALFLVGRCVARPLLPWWARRGLAHDGGHFSARGYPEALAAAEAGLALEPRSEALLKLKKEMEAEVAESPEVQKSMHHMRLDKRKNAKLQQVLKGLNLGGTSSFNTGGSFSPEAFNSQFNQPMAPPGFGGMGGMGGAGMGSMAQSEEQMRAMARAMATATASASAGGKVEPIVINKEGEVEKPPEFPAGTVPAPVVNPVDIDDGDDE